MKGTILLAALCMIGLLMLPRIGMAEMVALSEDQLNEITGQAGIAVDPPHSIINMHMDNLTTVYGILTLSGVTMIGAIDSRNSMNTDILKQMTTPVFGMMGFGTMAICSHLIDMTIDINQFTIDAIRPGSDPTGPSLGSFGIWGLHADIKGSMSITTH